MIQIPKGCCAGFSLAALAIAIQFVGVDRVSFGQADRTSASADVSALRKQLGSGNKEDDRKDAAFALGQLGRSAKDAVPDLVSALIDLEFKNWTDAADALIKIGPPASAECKKAVKVGNEAQRLRLLPTLSDLYVAGDKTLESVFVDLLQDRSVEVRAIAAHYVRTKTRMKSAIPILVGMIKNDEEAVRSRRSAVFALGSFGAEASHGAPWLERIFRNRKNDNSLRGSVVIAMAQIAPDGKNVVAFLESVVADEKESLTVRSDAALGLSNSRVADSSVPTLISVLQKTSKITSKDAEFIDFRFVVATTMSSLQPRPEAVPALTELFAGQMGKTFGHDGQVRAHCLIALGKVGPAAKGAVPVLLDALDDAELHESTVGLYAATLRKMMPTSDAIALLNEFAERSEGGKDRAKMIIRDLAPKK